MRVDRKYRWGGWGDIGKQLRVLVVTGTQTTYPRENGYIWEVLEGLPKPDYVLSGGCIGVDAVIGRFYAENYPKVRQTICLPIETQRGKTSYWWETFQQDGSREIDTWNTRATLIGRNEKMAYEASMYDHPRGLAFPKERDEQLRSGTWATIRRFRKYSIPHLIYPLVDAPRS